ncbi:unnamed protein product [Soboliphyme baturini]|uniref:BPI2 domain-containing protein n=1 Tax=Soboliphyme baturini TaxID=241478 RepID=A0A183J3X7_9BILA|nr:unnamed protein product [Soboliphyme baturini]
MRSMLLIAKVLLTTLCLCSVSADKNPGIIFRLSPAGVIQTRNIVSAVFNSLMSNLYIRDVFQGERMRKKISISDLKIVRFRPPEQFLIDLQANGPNQILIQINDFDFDASANVNTEFRILRSATFYISIVQMTLTMGLRVQASSSRLMDVKISQCHVELRKVHLRLYNVVGSRLIMRFAVPIIRLLVKRFIERNFCKNLQSFGGTAFSKFFANIPSKVPILRNRAKMRQARVTRSVLKAKPQSELLRKFLSYLQSLMVGEISANGMGGTPFDPKPIGDLDKGTNRMVSIAIGEYVINSLLYHLLKQGFFSFSFDGKNSARMSQMLQTTCDSLCIGTVVPMLEEKYPNEKLALQIKFTNPPRVEINPSGLVIYVNAVERFIIPRRNVVGLSGNITAVATVKLRSIGDRIYGTVSFLKFTFTPNGHIKMTDLTKGLLNDIPKAVAESKMNEFLQRGLKLPNIRMLRFYNPFIRPGSNAIWLNVNFHLDQQSILATVQKMKMGLSTALKRRPQRP